MNIPPVRIVRINHDKKTLETIAYLENAFSISYQLKINDCGNCGFKIPKNDPKTKYMQLGNFIEIYDSGRRIDLFRIVDIKSIKDKSGAYLDVFGMQAATVLSTKIMFHMNYREIVGYTTPDVINYVLTFPDEVTGEPKQTDWILGDCEFDFQIDYSFENMQMLEAIFNVTKNWSAEYLWDFDTTSYPFKIHLRKPDNNIKSEIRTTKNLISLTLEEDYRNLANKVYALGKGEGVNQVHLVNARDLEADPPTVNGEYFVKDDESIAKYGTVEALALDRTIEDKEYLIMLANKTLKAGKDVPQVYTVKAADIYPVTHRKEDSFRLGDVCRVVETELGITYSGRILKITKKNMTGDPGEVELSIGDPPYDLPAEIKNIMNRQNRTDKISQGATNIFPYTFADNCDPSHPITVNFILPDDLLYVNKCDLYFSGENFRAYEKGAAGGGATVVTTQSTSTPAGGGTTSSAGGTPTTNGGGGTTVTSGEQYTSYTYADPSGTDTSWYTTTKWKERIFENDREHLTYEPPVMDDGNGEYQYDNFFCYPAHSQQRIDTEIPPTIWLAQHTHPHEHTVSIPDHYHIIESHVHEIPNHEHAIPPLSVTIDEHEHDLDYGIYEANKSYSGFVVKIDGNTVAGVSQEANGIDIIPYLTKDGDGKVTRGMHTMTITPTRATNQEGLARVTGQIYIQCFVQSRGDYSVLNNTSQY